MGRAAQRRFTLAELIHALDRVLSTTEDRDWTGQVRWLHEWREGRWRRNATDGNPTVI